MSASFEDRSGMPPTVEEIEESLGVVTRMLVRPDTLLKLPPELAVMMPSIRRQLELLLVLARAAEKK